MWTLTILTQGAFFRRNPFPDGEMDNNKPIKRLQITEFDFVLLGFRAAVR
jgi:hypothetical protein